MKISCEHKRYLLFFLASAVFLFITSHNSFLYAINDSEDVNCFTTSANLLLSGKQAYKDFFEQKGPIVYWIHAVILYLYPDSYHGLYFLEVICAFFYHVYNYKILKLILKDSSDKKLTILCLLSCGLTYTSSCISKGGEIEEYLLPLFSYLLYHMLKTFMSEQEPKKAPCIYTGIHAAIIFWTKYFALLMHIVCLVILTIMLLKNKQGKKLCKILLFCIIGFLSVSVPIIIYFAAENSLSDLIRVYFHDNIFIYNIDDPTGPMGMVMIFTTIIACYVTEFVEYLNFVNLLFIAALLIAANNIKAIKEKYDKKTIHLFSILIYAMPLGIILIGKKTWSYYMIPVLALSPFLVTVCSHSIKTKRLAAVGSVLTIILSVTLSLILTKPFDAIKSRQQIAAMIKPNSDLIVLNKMDDGYFMMTHNIPDRYYFTLTNCHKSEIQDLYRTLIEAKQTDYVIYYGADPAMPHKTELLQKDITDTINIRKKLRYNNYTEIACISLYDTDYNCIILFYKNDKLSSANDSFLTERGYTNVFYSKFV